MLRKDLPIYLLMTGLYENVSDLQNESNMTFLLRTPKIELTSLNRTGVVNAYIRACGVADLLKDLNVTNSKYSVYRKRLADKGLINTEERGYVSASLPRFHVFIENRDHV